MLENITLDNIFSKISKCFTKDRKITFIVTFIIGLLVHFTLYSNELLAYDAYWHYGSFLAKGWEISLGRCLIPFSDMLRGSVGFNLNYDYFINYNIFFSYILK